MFRAFAHRLPERLLAVFRGKNIFYHISAAALTYVLVISGFDWYFFEATRSPYLHIFVIAAGISGFLVPVFVPIGMYIVGKLRKDAALVTAGAASGQAVIIAWLISSFYKALTGRIQPEFFTQTSSVDISHDFNFGFLKNGIFWGWPSSHAAVASALAATLFILYPESRVIRYAAVLYAILVALGAGIGFHWLSDVLAGLIIGVLVGSTVAKSALRSHSTSRLIP